MRRIALLAAALAGLAACSSADQLGGCLTPVYDAVEVTVTDSVTGAPIASIASGTIDAFQYSAALGPGRTSIEGELITLAGGEGHPGTYTVHVRAPGYAEFVVSGVRAAPARCTGVETAQVTARLQPLP